MTRAQIALEFIIFTMMGIFVVLILIGIGGRLTLQELSTQGSQEAQGLANMLQEELIIAAQVQPGYHRIIEIPATLRRGEYAISNTEDAITIQKEGVTITLKTPPLNGTLVKGRNVISNDQETLSITN